MPDPQSDIQTALSVRRGQKRLKDLPDEERGRISVILRKVSDATFADLARAEEKSQERSFIPRRPLTRG